MTLTFEELRGRWPIAPGPVLAEAFDSLSEREQRECWRDLAEQRERWIDAEMLYEQRLREQWPPPRRERLERCASGASRRPPALALLRDDPLRAIPPSVFVEALTGVAVTGRAIRCPLPGHAERTPSFHVYDDGFYCFGCNRGGSIIDFAAALYGLETRGAGYTEIRRRLAAELGLRSAA